jgi:hypothetical protein
LSRLQRVLGSLAEHPSYTLMRGVARFSSARRVVSGARSILHRRRMAAYLDECESKIAESPFSNLDRADFVSKLRTDGAAFGLVLPEATVLEIRAWAAASTCYADRSEILGFPLARRQEAETSLGKPILLGQYFNSAEECPAITRLESDPVLRWIACTFLESIPAFIGANIWWTFPVQALEEDRDRHAHLFHRDVDDFRFFKFFFYLTDVAHGEGAHVCVLGSHRRPPIARFADRWDVRRYSDTEVERNYAKDKILEVCGPAGTGFAENTLCVHKGLTPLTAARLLFQLQYALFDYGVAHDRRDPTRLRRLV